MQATHIDPLTGENEMDMRPEAAGFRINRDDDVAVDPNDPRTWGKVQRNAPVPCGSGRKYKRCCGAN